MNVLNVVGARPNFMKMAPIVDELRRREIPQTLVHTGQHYDANMSQVFFAELGLPQPDIYLGIGSDSHARQTARIMTEFETICQEHQPDWVQVCGDVNSTIACALVAAKLQIPVAHVEAGLRSFDRAMPEEINRVLTDHISDLLFTTESSGNLNLENEGIAAEKIHFVGNCMVDTLLKHREAARAREPWRDFDMQPGDYALLTLHRPSNVDDADTLRALMTVIGDMSAQKPVIFPAHPRTRSRMRDAGIATPESLRLCDPLPYLAFTGLMSAAAAVLTDSGGIQEEATVLDIPCLTLRWNTERPITIEQGTNELVGTDPDALRQQFARILQGDWKQGARPPLWDGRASERIVDVLVEQAVTAER
jgi:UDP-N-acetylglucosamine 2-epimerase (non-hydrolysing)